MISHPLIWGALLAQWVGIVTIATAAAKAIPIAIHYDLSAATKRQLELERKTEQIDLLGRFGLFCMCIGGILFISTLSLVLPTLIPGAMCGTGVLQATAQGTAQRAFITNAIALFLLFMWRSGTGLDNQLPIPTLAPTTAKILIVSAGCALVAGWDLLTLSYSIDRTTPVDCCNALYNTMGSNTASPWFRGFAGTQMWLTLLGSTWILFTAWTYRKTSTSKRRSPIVTIVLFLWIILAWKTLTQALSPYHFQVLAHHCPFCLLKTEHYMVGYPLFGLLLYMAWEGAALWMHTALRSTFPPISVPAARRIEIGTWRLIAAAILFLTLAFFPVIRWRLQFGVWITG